MQDDPNQPVKTSYQAPVSNPLKEGQPFGEPIKPPENFIRPSEIEPIISPEVASAGVYKVSDKVKLDQEAKALGIEPAKESANVVTTSTGRITLPMSYSEAVESAKGNPSNSSTWIGALVRLVYKRLGAKNV